MRYRLLWLVLLLGCLGWIGLEVVKWQFGLGSYAKSPQRLALAPGQRVVAGGGRALVGLVSRDQGGVEVEVECAADGKTTFELADSSWSGETCGVSVRWFGPAERGQRIEVRWDDGSQPHETTSP